MSLINYISTIIQDMNLDTSFLSLCISHKLHVIYAWVVGEGELYTWGSNENGCLGIGYLSLKYFFEKCSWEYPLFSLNSPIKESCPFIQRLLIVILKMMDVVVSVVQM